MQKKVSDLIAEFLKNKEIKHVFGIIGAGNAHIFDSIQSLGYTEIICVHHEQAACMAMQTYYRTSGRISAALLTTGGGSTNGITGVVSAWADSIPGIIISGNENSKYIDLHKDVRMWGVQGYDCLQMVERVTKYTDRVLDPRRTVEIIDKALKISLSGRPGPCWIDIPMNIQSSIINLDEINLNIDEDFNIKFSSPGIEKSVKDILENLKSSKRPLFWLGNGIRLSGAQPQVEALIEKFQIPAIVSWAGIDLIDSYHPLVFGRAGTYGQRCANFVLQNCDFLICIGTRLSISQIGYDISEIAREAKIAFVDIDKNEIDKLDSKVDYKINADAKEFIVSMLDSRDHGIDNSYSEWIERCNYFKAKYPWVNENDHPDKDGFINSYTFMEKLNDHLKENQIITTDMGTALLSGHQVLRIKKGQRLMTSTGLGEMGYGLPAAIGASIASNKGEVLCLNCDGGMMMNLQELQTIIHNNLPIKIIIFNNDGYLMIKHTQNALFKGRKSGVDKSTGVSCPNYSELAAAFKFPAFKIKTWDDFDKVIPEIQNLDGPLICEVFMHPQQLFVPKLSLAIQEDGTLISPPLEDLSPFIPREELQKNMYSGLHEKSLKITVK